MKTINSLTCILLFSVLLMSCTETEKISAEYEDEMNDWKRLRDDFLRTNDGYLALAGLYWLQEGANTYGSDSSNAIIFPGNTPGFIGTIFLEGDRIFTLTNPEAGITGDGLSNADTLNLNPDISGEKTILKFKSLSWYVIKRADKYGIRVKDSEYHTLTDFKGVTYFDLNPRWNVQASFVSFDPPKEIPIQNIVGFTTLSKSPGKLVFEVDNIIYSLDVMEEEDQFFVIFGDYTNGKSTYGGGRYMYTEQPDENGFVRLDFNKSYNPPCAFTEFATCPLPPKQNILKVELNAGEYTYEGATH